MKRKALRSRKNLALLLALVMSLSLFTAGCGTSAGAGPGDGAAALTESPSPSAMLAELTKVSAEDQPQEQQTDRSEVQSSPGPAASDEPVNSPAPAPGNDAGASPSVTPGSEPGAPTMPPEGSTFAVHFIDVGQADAALVLCDGNAMLIDGGNAADSNLIYSYLKKLSLTHLDYIVCSHAHEDHVGGLSGALNYATVGTALAPVTSYDSKAFGNFVSYLAKQNVSITVPSAGDNFTLGSASVKILGPVTSSDEPNNTSIVLRIVYGDTSFLFAGDAEREEEQDILSAGYDLDSTVLKVGHHGSDSSTSYVWLREIMPEYAVISVGKDNSYGHPTDAVLSRLRDADVETYRTDMQGDVICTSDGKTVSFAVARNADADTLASVGPNSTMSEPSQPVVVSSPETTPTPEVVNPIPVGTDYILNTNTHKFHYPSCGSVKQMSEKNKQAYTGNREDVISMGYVPCKKCNP